MNSHFNTTGTHQPSFFRFKDKILLFAIAFFRAAFLLLFSSNGCWSGFKTDLIPVHLRQWGGQLLRARTLEVNKDALNVHEHQYSRSEASHVSIVLFLLVFLQGLLLWSLALQLVRDWYVLCSCSSDAGSPTIHSPFKHREYHSERWDRFTLLCHTEKSCFQETKGSRLCGMHLNSVSNLRAWLRLRSYLRDVKGKMTLELLRFCWMLFFPLLLWGLFDMFLDVTLSRSGHTISVSYWRIDRTFDTFMSWWCIYRVFAIGEHITTAMKSHSWVLPAERLQIEFDLCQDNVADADKKEMKRVDACMKKGAEFLHLAAVKERVTLLSFQLDRSSLDALLKFLYGYVGLLIAIFVQEFADTSVKKQ